jgi:HAD superfamily hydrolase (TIGR01509 family)
VQIKAVVFDLDGVLFDACDLHYQALNRALEQAGYKPISREDHEGKFDGLPTRVKMKMLGIEGDEAAKVWQLKQQNTASMLGEVVKIDTGTVALLQGLRDRGYKLACASNSIRQSVDIMVGGVGAAPFMEFTLSNEDVGNPKPHPDIYLEACRRFSLQPREVLVVEDNINGQRACLEAGCRLCAVNNPAEVTIERILCSIRDHEAVGDFVPAPGRHRK